jgi:hypothetical protein
MGSLLLPVIANFFMKDSEGLALGRATYKLICWFHYVDDIHDLASWTRKTE